MTDVWVMAYHPLHNETLKAKVRWRIEKEGFYPLFRVEFSDGYVAHFIQSDCTLVGDGGDHIENLPVAADLNGDLFAAKGIVKPQ